MTDNVFGSLFWHDRDVRLTQTQANAMPTKIPTGNGPLQERKTTNHGFAQVTKIYMKGSTYWMELHGILKETYVTEKKEEKGEHVQYKLRERQRETEAYTHMSQVDVA